MQRRVDPAKGSQRVLGVDVLSVLRQVLDQLDAGDSHSNVEFLFAHDPSGDMSVLTNQHAIAHAYAEYIATAVVHQDRKQHTQHIQSAYIPCFVLNSSCRSVTVGVSHTQMCAVAVQTGPGPAGTAENISIEQKMTGRYQFDCETGNRISVYFREPIMIIVFREVVGTTGIRVHILGARSQPFLCARAENDLCGMNAAVFMHELIEGVRGCTTCRSATDCLCVAVGRRPAHPMDFSLHIDQHRRSCGAFEMESVSQVSERLGADESILRRMRSWLEKSQGRPVLRNELLSSMMPQSLSTSSNVGIMQLSQEVLVGTLLPQSISTRLQEVTSMTRRLSVSRPLESDSTVVLKDDPRISLLRAEGDKPVLGSERRRELRKQRNRDAATRSNAVRKAKLVKLRCDMAESQRKVEELEARKTELEGENRRLRVHLVDQLLDSDSRV